MRALSAAGLVLAVAFVSVAPASSTGSPPSGLKGYRAVIFSGAQLKEPVLVADSEQATELYIALLRGARMAPESLVVLKGRACMHVAAFTYGPRTVNIPVDQLPPEAGDFNVKLVLFEPGVLPVVTSGNLAIRVSAYASQLLSSLGVPVSNETREAGACPPPG